MIPRGKQSETFHTGRKGGEDSEKKRKRRSPKERLKHEKTCLLIKLSQPSMSTEPYRRMKRERERQVTWRKELNGQGRKQKGIIGLRGERIELGDEGSMKFTWKKLKKNVKSDRKRRSKAKSQLMGWKRCQSWWKGRSRRLGRYRKRGGGMPSIKERGCSHSLPEGGAGEKEGDEEEKESA